jgi:hypothetical protein
MNRVVASSLAVAFLACSLAAQSPPAPRSSAKDYQASKVESQYSIGAKLLSKTQVQNSFATPLAGRYVVVEVGFYPAEGKTIDLQHSNFALVRSDDKSTVSPSTPEQIASILQKRPRAVATLPCIRKHTSDMRVGRFTPVPE